MSKTARCTAKRFYVERGYGFVVTDEGEDIFLHKSMLAECGFGMPPLGATVEVEYRPSHKGLEVARVISVEGGTAPLGSTIPEQIVPARVKFFDFRRGFGFAAAFGFPITDVFFNANALDAFPCAPAPGEAVGLIMSGDEKPRADRVLRWEQVIRNGEVLDVCS